jgi:hypothetical protein
MLNNIDPKLWNGWKFLNSIALTYDNKYKKQYILFFENLKYTLPCEICKVHYTEYFDKSDKETVFKNSDNLLNWLITLRNNIYKMNKRNKSFNVQSTIDEIFNKSYNFNLLIIFFIILILLYIYYKIE